MCGVLMIPFLKSQYYNHLINMLIGLAFGCMSGDALFHLLPTVLGIHSHTSGQNSSDNDDHDHNHSDHNSEHRHGEESHDHGNYMWLMVAILATIYALFLFEVFSQFIASKRKVGN